jgi:hypothetical protein
MALSAVKRQLVSLLRETPPERFRYSPYTRTACSLLLYSYLQITSSCLTYVNCVEVNGKRVVFDAPAIECDSADYNRWLPLVVLLIVLEVCLFPLLVLVFLFRRRTDIMKSDARFRKSYGVLFESFVPGCWFWTPWALARQTLLIVLGRVYRSSHSIRYLAFTYFNALMMLLTAVIKPNLYRVENTAEILAHFFLSLLSSFFAAQLPPYDDRQRTAVVSFIIPYAVALLILTAVSRLLEEDPEAGSEVEENQHSHHTDSNPAKSRSGPESYFVRSLRRLLFRQEADAIETAVMKSSPLELSISGPVKNYFNEIGQSQSSSNRPPLTSPNRRLMEAKRVNVSPRDQSGIGAPISPLSPRLFVQEAPEPIPEVIHSSLPANPHVLTDPFCMDSMGTPGSDVSRSLVLPVGLSHDHQGSALLSNMSNHTGESSTSSNFHELPVHYRWDAPVVDSIPSHDHQHLEQFVQEAVVWSEEEAVSPEETPGSIRPHSEASQEVAGAKPPVPPRTYLR